MFVFISFILIIVQVWLELKMPDYMSQITVLVQTSGSSMNDILINGFYMLLCTLGSLITAIITGYIVANITSRFSMNTRRKLFTKVQDMCMEDVKKFQISSLITRTTNDITQIEMFLTMGLVLLVKAPVTSVWAISKILNKNFEWSVLTGFAILILLTVVAILIIVVIPKFKIVQKLIDRLNGVTRENLNGIRVIRAFNAEDYQEKKFDVANNNLTNQLLFNQKAFAIMSPVMYLVLYFLTLAIYYVGAFLIDSASMSIKLSLFGDMIVFSSYSMQVIMSFLVLAMIFMMLPRAQVSARRVNEVLDTDDKILFGNAIKGCESGTIEFKDVSFKYADAEECLLKNISFKANKGEVVAFIGSTGSGKSTLVNLIPRFYDATDGSIFVDGINVKDYKEDVLNDLIGYVPQKAVLFDGTVSSNVSYGKNVSFDVIKKSISIAQAEDFVLKMDGSYDSHIASGGSNISGGQKQRLSIARAIAKNPEIYIFDDSFSALDYKTDSLLRKNLKKYTKDATVLIVATRIGTIMNADKIIVLEKGSCVGIGTHKELLKSCDVYREIALSQLSKEELDNE
jgi:ATP-binding cassette subfamily B protein